MTPPVLVSVVRDFAMYDRCLRTNPNCRGCTFAPLDNRVRNEGIPLKYNAFLDSRPADEEAWYVFCHEDFEPREPLLSRLEGLDTACLRGPIGARTRVRFGIYHEWQLVGRVAECAKDGSGEHELGRTVPPGTPVETFDCQCLIVHSSLVHRHNLRFDEHLTFDLYVEDFCRTAAQRGIPSRILPFAACHWSGGNVLPRYYEQEAYLAKKYPNDCFTGTSSWILGGCPPLARRMTVALKRFVRRLSRA